MDYNLDIVIELYEREKLALENKIEECLEDIEGPDYELAGYHQKALNQIEITLRILNSFKDPLFEEKERSFSKIKFFEKELKKSKPVLPPDYLIKVLDVERERLEKLKSILIPDQSPLAETVLDKAVSDLIVKKIKKFRLVLRKSEYIYFDFSHVKKTIKVTFPNIRQHIKNDIFDDSQLEDLKKNGFQLINRDKLQTIVDIQDYDTTFQYIRFLLVKIIFEILFFTGNNNESYIEF